MHARRLACFLLGLWLAGGVVMAWVTRENLGAADRLWAHRSPAATLRLKALGPDARSILRLQALEENRRLSGKWETAQIVFGSLFFLAMLFGSRENKFVLLGVLLLTALVLLQKFLITPELNALARLVDVLPEGQLSPERNRLWVVDAAGFGVEAGKALVALVLTASLVFSSKRSGRSRDARRELNGVDKPDHRGVYR
jgi:hypothetical protein